MIKQLSIVVKNCIQMSFTTSVYALRITLSLHWIFYSISGPYLGRIVGVVVLAFLFRFTWPIFLPLCRGATVASVGCWGGPMQWYKAIRFNVCITSGFGGHFKFFDFKRFLTGSCSPNMLMHIFILGMSKPGRY